MAEVSGERIACNYFDEMTKLGKRQHHFLWIAAMCYFFDMMDMNLFGMISQPVQAYFGLTLEHMGTLNSMSFYGMFFGGIFGGWLSDKVGRKKALLTCITIFSLSSIGNAFFDHFFIFAACRFLNGFGVIGMNIIAMVYITEMMPSQSRGKFQGLTIASGTIAVPFAGFLAAWIIPMSTETWRIMFIIGGAGIILVPLGLVWLLESPRWLVGKGRVSEAEAVVAECVGHPVDLSAKAADCDNSSVSMLETIRFMFSKGQTGNTLVLAVMAIGGVTGGFYLANWNYNLLVQMGLPLAGLLMVGAFAGFAAPCGDLLSSAISDKGGRKTPIVIMFFLATVACLCLGKITTVMQFGVFNFLRTAFACCSVTMFWTYLSENLPNRYRSSATGLIMSVSRVLIAVLTPTVPIIFHAYGWFGCNAVNSIMYLIPAILALFFGSKTAKKTLEEIEAEAKAAK